MVPPILLIILISDVFVAVRKEAWIWDYLVDSPVLRRHDLTWAWQRLTSPVDRAEGVDNYKQIDASTPPQNVYYIVNYLLPLKSSFSPSNKF